MRRSRISLLLALLLAGGCGDAPAPEPEPLPPEVQALIDDLMGDDAAAQMAAHKKLPEYGEVVVAPLAALLDRDDVDDGVGAWIAEVLGALGPRARDAAPALGRRLRKGGECTATTSWALERMGALGLPELIASMASEHEKTREWASDAIRDVAGEIGEEAAPARDAMVKALAAPEKWSRTNALAALSYIGPAARSAGPAIVARIGDTDGDVAIAAVDAVARLDLWGAEAYARIEGLLQSTDEERHYARTDAVEVVREHVKDDAVAIPLLRLGLRDGTHEDYRYHAIRMLLARGVDDAALAAEFAEVDAHAEIRVVMWHAEQLVPPGPNAQRVALPLLRRALRKGDEAQRVRAAALIAKTGRVARGDEATMQALEHYAHHSGEWPAVRAACRKALDALRAPK